jgi:hypothetical protein
VTFRVSRAWRWGGSAIALVWVVASILRFWTRLTEPPWRVAQVITWLLVAFLWGILPHTTSIRLDGDGITSRTMFGSRRTAWNEIERFEWRGWPVGSRVRIVRRHGRSRSLLLNGHFDAGDAMPLTRTVLQQAYDFHRLPHTSTSTGPSRPR